MPPPMARLVQPGVVECRREAVRVDRLDQRGLVGKIPVQQALRDAAGRCQMPGLPGQAVFGEKVIGALEDLRAALLGGKAARYRALLRLDAAQVVRLSPS